MTEGFRASFRSQAEWNREELGLECEKKGDIQMMFYIFGLKTRLMLRCRSLRERWVWGKGLRYSSEIQMKCQASSWIYRPKREKRTGMGTYI